MLKTLPVVRKVYLKVVDGFMSENVCVILARLLYEIYILSMCHDIL